MAGPTATRGHGAPRSATAKWGKKWGRGSTDVAREGATRLRDVNRRDGVICALSVAVVVAPFPASLWFSRGPVLRLPHGRAPPTLQPGPPPTDTTGAVPRRQLRLPSRRSLSSHRPAGVDDLEWLAIPDSCPPVPDRRPSRPGRFAGSRGCWEGLGHSPVPHPVAPSGRAGSHVERQRGNPVRNHE